MSEATSAVNHAYQLKQLGNAIALFNQHSDKLELTYQTLENRVNDLTHELNRKNEELAINLKEKDLLNLYLKKIIDNAGGAIIVVDRYGRIELMNGHAREMIEMGMPLDDLIETNTEVRTKNTPGIGERKFRDTKGMVRYIQISASDLVDLGNTIIGTILHIQDTTKLRKLQEQAERNNRLTALGSMISQIAHEIRNPLGSLELFASILKRELASEEQTELIDHIIAGIRNLNHVVTNHLNYTRSLNLNQRSIGIHQLIEESLTFTSHLLQDNPIRIERHFTALNDVLTVDPNSLVQVFINIVHNALQAMEKDGILTITTSVGSDGEEFSIRFEDNGKGIDEKHLEKVFDPFFSTKETGTGLGLAICNTIIGAHAGTIDIESKRGIGTTVTIHLPYPHEQRSAE